MRIPLNSNLLQSRSSLTQSVQHLCQKHPHLTLLLSAYPLIAEAYGSHTGPETGYQTEVFRDFPLDCHENSGKIAEIRLRQLPSLSFPIHFLRITVSLDAT